MASAPQRRESLCNTHHNVSTSPSKPRTSLEMLMGMGFPKKRAEKAIAATGNKSADVAADWLLSHHNDLTVDKDDVREYIIYLCPTGDFHSQLDRYYLQTSKQFGRNDAHKYHPHITLCPFFKIPNSKVSVIDHVISVMESAIQEWSSIGYEIGLKLETKNNNFIAYFVSMPIHDLLDDLMIRVQKEFNAHGVDMGLLQKQLHLTLAFMYKAEGHDKLYEMAQSLIVPQNMRWEIRVYSRDQRLKTSDVYRIIKHHPPQRDDELELKTEDHIIMNPQEIEKSLDGWYLGSSHLTGASGFFPGNFIEPCSQMRVWTLHRYVVLQSQTKRLVEGANASTESSETEYDNLWVQVNGDLYATVNKRKLNFRRAELKPPEPKTLFIMRHGQRCDFNFKEWFKRSFNHEGVYTRLDLNCPSRMLQRSSYKDFSNDVPLTEIGLAQAFITGEGLKEAQQEIPFVYSSPSLRCIQTTTQVLKGLKSKALICVEPGLFEWCGWCQEGVPNFMTVEELTRAGFPVDQTYIPFLSTNVLKHKETVEDYYQRSYATARYISNRHMGGKILMVGHNGTMDACSRQLRGKPAKTTDLELRDVVRGAPYCFLCTVVGDPVSDKWDLCQPPILPLSHGGNKEYDWRNLRD